MIRELKSILKEVSSVLKEAQLKILVEDFQGFLDSVANDKIIIQIGNYSNGDFNSTVNVSTVDTVNGKTIVLNSKDYIKMLFEFYDSRPINIASLQVTDEWGDVIYFIDYDGYQLFWEEEHINY